MLLRDERRRKGRGLPALDASSVGSWLGEICGAGMVLRDDRRRNGRGLPALDASSVGPRLGETW